MIPNTPASHIENGDVSFPHDYLSLECDSSSEDAPEAEAGPPLRETDGEDGMQVDVTPESGTRCGLKRKWNDSIDPGQSGSASTTSEPKFKRSRMGASREAPPPIIETFHYRDDEDFIELIRAHGGRVVDANGMYLRLELPGRSELRFRVTMTCIKLERVLRNIDFPGRQEFIPNAFAQFAGSLEEASLANEAALVRRLLATGMGKTAGEVLEHILNEARARGADDAVICLRAACAGAAGVAGLAPRSNALALLPGASVNPSVTPAPNWREELRKSIAPKDLAAAISSLADSRNTEQVVNLVFGGASRRPAGTFSVCSMFNLSTAFLQLLSQCGAVLFNLAQRCLVLHAPDFDISRLKRELADLQSRENEHDFTALMFAAQWGDTDLVSHLLAQGARLEARDETGATAMIYAPCSRKIDIVRLLLQHGSNVHAHDSRGISAMNEAVAAGDTGMWELLLRHGALVGPEPNEEEGEEARHVPPICTAAEVGRTDACIWLLGRGADIEIKWRQTSAFLLAALRGHLDTCKALIALGARLDSAQNEQHSLLSATAYSGNRKLFQYFLEKGVREDDSKPFTPLIAAVENHQLDMLRFLLDNGADIDRKGASGTSALLMACKLASLEAVELLLERGATCTDEKLLHAAGAGGNAKIVDLIAGRRASTPPVVLFNALQQAVMAKSKDAVQKLLEMGAPTDPTEIGLPPAENPLLLINFSGEQTPEKAQSIVGIAQALIVHGVPLHHTDLAAMDPLMQATAQGHLGAIKLMLEGGAWIGQTCSSGNALQIAMTRLARCLNKVNARKEQKTENWSRVVFALLNAMDTQEDRSTLARDAVNQTKHWFIQDMVLGARNAVPEPYKDSRSPLLLSLLDGTSLPSRNLALFLQKHQDALLSLQADPSFDEKMRDSLVRHGFLHSVIDLMLPFLKALPAMALRLCGKREKNTGADLTAFCGGMLTVLKHRFESTGLLNPYARFPIDMTVKDALQDTTLRMLNELFAHGEDFEAGKLSACFSKLFEICLETTMQGMEGALLMTPIQPVPGQIAQALVRESVYANLAEAIEAAWIEAWGAIGSAQAAGAYADDFSSSDSLRTSSASHADDVWNDFFSFDDQQSENSPPEPYHPATGGTLPRSFAETRAATDLLAAFRDALRRRIDTPGTSILHLPNASAEAEQIYSDLMFRQLHMLAQFIKPQPETDALSSASSSSMSAAASM